MSDWGRYGTEIDLADPEDSRATVLRAVRRQDAPLDILELGCSSGRTTSVLKGWGHRVTAVELDPEFVEAVRPFVERVVHGDLDSPSTLGALAGSSFDLIIAADVLEHLREPTRCLRQALDLLRPGGVVVLSIPNVGHGDLRLALLDGQFEYSEIGLLDRTHVQLFTRSSLERLVHDAGLQVTHWDRVAKLIGHTEVAVDPAVLDWGRMVLVADPDSITYQWVIECRRADDPLAAMPTTGTPASDGSDWWHPAPRDTLFHRINHVAGHLVRLEADAAAAAAAAAAPPPPPPLWHRVASIARAAVRRVMRRS